MHFNSILTLLALTAVSAVYAAPTPDDKSDCQYGWDDDKHSCMPKPKCDYGWDKEHNKCYDKPCDYGYDDKVCHLVPKCLTAFCFFSGQAC